MVLHLYFSFVILYDGEEGPFLVMERVSIHFAACYFSSLGIDLASLLFALL